MNEPRLTLIGVVTDPPLLNRTQKANLPVANFWVSCTDRVFNREQRRWQQGSTLRMKVVCWRGLAENVAASIHRGDPVLVTGVLRARQYQDRSGRRVNGFEVTAASVGPDLNRGTATFARSQPTLVELPDHDVPPTVEAPPLATHTLGVAALAAVGLVPTEPAPAEPAPTESASAESAPAESAPAEPASAESVPVGSAHAEAASADGARAA